MISRFAGLVLMSGLMGEVATAAAQGRPPAGARAAERDEAFKMIDAYIVSNLEESLGLDEAQFARMMPLVKKLQTEKRERAQRRMKAMAALRARLQAGGGTEPEIADLLRDLRQAEADEAATHARNLAAIDGALSVVQQAKFRVMLAEVEHKIRQLMMRARAENRGGRRRPDR